MIKRGLWPRSLLCAQTHDSSRYADFYTEQFHLAMRPDIKEFPYLKKTQFFKIVISCKKLIVYLFSLLTQNKAIAI